MTHLEYLLMLKYRKNKRQLQVLFSLTDSSDLWNIKYVTIQNNKWYVLPQWRTKDNNKEINNKFRSVIQ